MGKKESKGGGRKVRANHAIFIYAYLYSGANSAHFSNSKTFSSQRVCAASKHQAAWFEASDTILPSNLQRKRELARNTLNTFPQV